MYSTLLTRWCNCLSMEKHWFIKFNWNCWIDYKVGQAIKSNDIKIVVEVWYCFMLSSKVKFPHYIWHAQNTIDKMWTLRAVSQHQSHCINNLVQIECEKWTHFFFSSFYLRWFMGIGHVLSILLSDGIDVNINNSLNFNSKLFVSLNYFVLILLTTNF